MLTWILYAKHANIQNEAIGKMDWMCNLQESLAGYRYGWMALGRQKIIYLCWSKTLVWMYSQRKNNCELLLHLLFCLDLVHGDDDWILPLLLHHTGKKAFIKPHSWNFSISRTQGLFYLKYVHRNRNSWGFPLKLDWKTWWLYVGCMPLNCTLFHCLN